MHDRGSPAAPIPEFITEQRPTATQDKRALRRQVAGRDTELHARQQPGRPRADWNEQVRAATQARVALSEFQRRLSGRIAAHGETLAAAPERQRCAGIVAAEHNGVLSEASRGRSGAHGERCNALACGSETPLGSRTEPRANAEPDARRAVIVAVVVAKFLRGDRVEQRRDHGRIPDIPDLPIDRQLEAIGGRHRDTALPRPVGKPVAPESPELEGVVRRAPDEAGSGGEALHAIDVDQIAQRPRAEALAFEPGERAAARDAADFGTDVLQIVFADRLGYVLDGGAERAGPREGIARGFGQRRDLIASEKTRVEAQVEYVPVDLPASPDDAARGDVEPRGAAANLDLLAVREPESSFPERVVQHDADVLELWIEVGFGCEVERHPHQLGGFDIDEQGADDSGAGEVLGPHPQRDDTHRALREHDHRRVAQGEVVQIRPPGGERMRHIPHLIAFAQPDGGAEVVLHDAEVIAVVVDIGGELSAIAPADDALLAQLRRLPVHFQLQLIRFDEPRRLGEPFTELAQEEEKPVSFGLVVAQCGVDRGLRAALDGTPRQCQGGIAVPPLSRRTGGDGGGEDEQQYGGPAHSGQI